MNSHCPACRKRFKNGELVVHVQRVYLQNGSQLVAMDMPAVSVAHQTCPIPKVTFRNS